MDTFIDYIVEADYTRFLKKNRNLSKTDILGINTLYSKDNPRAGSDFGRKYDWQSRKVKNMTMDDFYKIYNELTDSKRKKVKAVKLKGLGGLKKNKDYVEVKTKTKSHKSVIPLTWTASKLIASKNIGDCEGAWCISYQKDRMYWEDYVLTKGQVPVMVIGGGSKWTVMIIKGNRAFHVWDEYDNKNSNNSRPFINKEVIPDFNIKKNLMTPKLFKLYDEIRKDYYGVNPDSKALTREVQIAYQDLAGNIENYFQGLAQADENHEEEYERILDDTIDHYEEKMEEAKSEAIRIANGSKNAFTKDFQHRIDSMEVALEAEPAGTGINKYEEPTWEINGVDYTKQEIEGYIDTYRKEFNRVSKHVEPNMTEYNEIKKIYDVLKEMQDDKWNSYNIEEYDNGYNSYSSTPIYKIEWTDYIPQEEGKYDSVHEYYGVNVMDDHYDPYFEFVYENDEDMDEEVREYLQDIIVQYDSSHGSENVDGKELLDEVGYKAPAEY